MENQLAKKTPLSLDSIDAFDNSVVGADGSTQGVGGFLPDGIVIRFTKTEKWLARNGVDDLTGKVLVHLDTLRTEVEWGKDKRPVKPPRILSPGEAYRDTEALNALIPRDRWVPGFDPGTVKGPIENQNVLVLGDIAMSMDRFIWPSPVTTIGSAIAVRELNTRVQRMRQFRGMKVYAKVKLFRAPFPTRFNKDQQRPALDLIGWVTPTEDGLAEVDVHSLPTLQQAPAVSAPQAPPKAAVISTSNTPPWEEVDEPSLSEEMKDTIKF